MDFFKAMTELKKRKKVRRVLNCSEQDKEILLAISYFDKCGKLETKE